MTPKLFGLEMVDQLADGWERSAHLAIGEVRDDGSIDMLMLLEGGTLRYVATLNPGDAHGVVSAPKIFDHLVAFTRRVLETNQPIVRRPSAIEPSFLLSVFPLVGRRKRVAYILEPDPAATPADPTGSAGSAA